MINILVTGSSGYIGSCFIYQLLSSYPNFNVIGIDKEYTLNKEKLLNKFSNRITFYKMDLLDRLKLEEVFSSNAIDVVIHFAAYTIVSESEVYPYKYLDNNINSTMNLVDIMLRYKVNNLVFSSSASVYGKAVYTPIDENHPLNPASFYGLSKKISEEIIINYKRKGLNYIILRYFNPAGAIDDISENHNPETHLIPILVHSLINNSKFKIYGDKYPTFDGTCIRDFIHIYDLVNAHILAIQYLLSNNSVHNIYNVGISKGYSVLEVVKNLEAIVNKKINYVIDKPREGDVPILIANSDKIKKELNFNPLYDLKDILLSALQSELNKNKA